MCTNADRTVVSSFASEGGRSRAKIVPARSAATAVRTARSAAAAVRRNFYLSPLLPFARPFKMSVQMQSSDNQVHGVQEDRGPPLLSGTPRSATKAGYGYETQSRGLYSSGRRSLGPTGYRGSMTYSGNYGGAYGASVTFWSKTEQKIRSFDHIFCSVFLCLFLLRCLPPLFLCYIVL